MEKKKIYPCFFVFAKKTATRVSTSCSQVFHKQAGICILSWHGASRASCLPVIIKPTRVLFLPCINLWNHSVSLAPPSSNRHQKTNVNNSYLSPVATFGIICMADSTCPPSRRCMLIADLQKKLCVKAVPRPACHANDLYKPCTSSRCWD